MVPAFIEASDEYNEDDDNDDNESTTVDDEEGTDDDADDDADTDDATVDKLTKGGMYEKEAPKCVRRRRDKHSSIHSRDTF